MMMAGASTIQVGTATFRQPTKPVVISPGRWREWAGARGRTIGDVTPLYRDHGPQGIIGIEAGVRRRLPGSRWSTPGGRRSSTLCVGLDQPPADSKHLLGKPSAILEFCAAISSAPPPISFCAYKPQFACWTAAKGRGATRGCVRMSNAAIPAMMVLLDAKRATSARRPERYAIRGVSSAIEPMQSR
jgi:hypothetical protein